MGFFSKLFGMSIDCPDCGARNARASFSGTKCPNPDCRNYDAALAKQARKGKASPDDKRQAPSGNVVFNDPIQAHYVNYRGERKTFTLDRQSLKHRKAHIRARVEPTGTIITLSKSRIENWEEIKEHVKG